MLGVVDKRGESAHSLIDVSPAPVHSCQPCSALAVVDREHDIRENELVVGVGIRAVPDLREFLECGEVVECETAHEHGQRRVLGVRVAGVEGERA